MRDYLWCLKWRLKSYRWTIKARLAGASSGGVLFYNDDKPHRCPSCHAVADPDHRCKREIVTCCACGTRFTAWPRFQILLREAGVVCPEHQPVDTSMTCEVCGKSITRLLLGRRACGPGCAIAMGI